MRGVAAFIILLVAGVFAAGAQAAFPGKNGQIVYSHGTADKAGLYLVNPDGTGAKQIVPSANPNIFQPLWSPDGAHILYDDSSQDEGMSIRVVDAAGNGMRVALQGSTAGGAIYGAAWTADGKVSWSVLGTALGNSLGICEVVEGEAQGRFCIAPLAGTAHGNLRENGRWSSTGRFAWIGSRLPVASFEQSDQLDLVNAGASAWSAGGGGGEETAITKTGATRFDWSPDGTKLVFQSSTGSDIEVVNADGSGEHQLGHKGFTPAWSPDGKKIVFADGKGIAVMNANGSGFVQITHDGDDGFPDWRPAATAYVPPVHAKPTAKPKKHKKPKKPTH